MPARDPPPPPCNHHTDATSLLAAIEQHHCPTMQRTARLGTAKRHHRPVIAPPCKRHMQTLFATGPCTRSQRHAVCVSRCGRTGMMGQAVWQGPRATKQLRNTLPTHHCQLQNARHSLRLTQGENRTVLLHEPRNHASGLRTLACKTRQKRPSSITHQQLSSTAVCLFTMTQTAWKRNTPRTSKQTTQKASP